MASLRDIGVSALINTGITVLFLLGFLFLSVQPINDRVYHPKLYLKGTRKRWPRANTRQLKPIEKYVNLEVGQYLRVFEWAKSALRKTEQDIIEHAGLDSAVYLRIYLVGLKIFVPVMVLGMVILIPINVGAGSLAGTGTSNANANASTKFLFSNIDKLSMSNVPNGSTRLWAHLAMSYVFTAWACSMLFMEYKNIAAMRLKFLSGEKRRPDQFTVMVLQVPDRGKEPLSTQVENYFRTNHPDYYLTHQMGYNANKLSKIVRKREKAKNWLVYFQLKHARNTSTRPTTKDMATYPGGVCEMVYKMYLSIRSSTGFWGLFGQKVDAIYHYEAQIVQLTTEAEAERAVVVQDPDATMPAAFVSFKSRWGAAVCAQTQQNQDPTLWLTDWAPEPRDVYWENLAIPYVQLGFRRLATGILMFLLVFFYMIPVATVQSLANLEGLQRSIPALNGLLRKHFFASFVQGFLPGLILKACFWLLPIIIMIVSKCEGHLARSKLDRRAAAKYYYFMVVNIFFGSILTGTAFQQLKTFVTSSSFLGASQALASIMSEVFRHSWRIERANSWALQFYNTIKIEEVHKELIRHWFLNTLAISIPQKASFFITYIMVDGWSGPAGEILRFWPLVMYHIKNSFLVKTERDRLQATSPGTIELNRTLPQLELYFLMGLVYSVITPIIIPFIIVFLAFGFVVYRYQIINVYDPIYESAGAFWPHVHGRIIAALILEHLTLIGLFLVQGPISFVKTAPGGSVRSKVLHYVRDSCSSTPFMIALPILTLFFHSYCKNRFEEAFKNYPLENAMEKDTIEKEKEPNLNLAIFLRNAYKNPDFFDEKEDVADLEKGQEEDDDIDDDEALLQDSLPQHTEDELVELDDEEGFGSPLTFKWGAFHQITNEESLKPSLSREASDVGSPLTFKHGWFYENLDVDGCSSRENAYIGGEDRGSLRRYLSARSFFDAGSSRSTLDTGSEGTQSPGSSTTSGSGTLIEDHNNDEPTRLATLQRYLRGQLSRENSFLKSPVNDESARVAALQSYLRGQISRENSFFEFYDSRSMSTRGIFIADDETAKLESLEGYSRGQFSRESLTESSPRSPLVPARGIFIKDDNDDEPARIASLRTSLRGQLSRETSFAESSGSPCILRGGTFACESNDDTARVEFLKTFLRGQLSRENSLADSSASSRNSREGTSIEDGNNNENPSLVYLRGQLSRESSFLESPGSDVTGRLASMQSCLRGQLCCEPSNSESPGSPLIFRRGSFYADNDEEVRNENDEEEGFSGGSRSSNSSPCRIGGTVRAYSALEAPGSTLKSRRGAFNKGRDYDEATSLAYLQGYLRGQLSRDNSGSESSGSPLTFSRGTFYEDERAEKCGASPSLMDSPGSSLKFRMGRFYEEEDEKGDACSSPPGGTRRRSFTRAKTMDTIREPFASTLPDISPARTLCTPRGGSCRSPGSPLSKEGRSSEGPDVTEEEKAPSPMVEVAMPGYSHAKSMGTLREVLYLGSPSFVRPNLSRAKTLGAILREPQDSRFGDKDEKELPRRKGTLQSRSRVFSRAQNLGTVKEATESESTSDKQKSTVLQPARQSA